MSSSTERRSPRLAILDYGMGNLRSVQRAWERVGAVVQLVENEADINQFDALVFPGQGAIMDTMKLLKSSGLDEVIYSWTEQNRPFFGICLGLQALFTHSEEGDTPCLNIFEGTVKRFRFPDSPGLKVPHMGWNHVKFNEAELLSGISSRDDQFYFVHSYFVETWNQEIIWGESEYGGKGFVSGIRNGNLVATQFHPEKSQAKGLQLYRNFLDIIVRPWIQSSKMT